MGDDLQCEFPPDESLEPSVAVVLAIAERTGWDPLEMPPLYENVDPEALDRLCQSRHFHTLLFEYAGYTVRLSGDGQIALEE